MMYKSILIRGYIRQFRRVRIDFMRYKAEKQKYYTKKRFNKPWVFFIKKIDIPS
jgi:hypothetical protein